MCVLRIIRVGTAWHFVPVHPQTWITKALQPNPGGVISRDGVVTHKLEKVAALGSLGLILRWIGQFFEKTILLFSRSLEKLYSKLILALRIKPSQADDEAHLHLTACKKFVLCGSHLVARYDRGSLCHHEIDKLSDAGLLRAGRFIRWQDHVRKALHHRELRRRKKERLVNLRSFPGRFGCSGMLRKGKRPAVETGERCCCGSKTHITKYQAPVDALSCHRNHLSVKCPA